MTEKEALREAIRRDTLLYLLCGGEIHGVTAADNAGASTNPPRRSAQSITYRRAREEIQSNAEDR